MVDYDPSINIPDIIHAMNVFFLEQNVPGLESCKTLLLKNVTNDMAITLEIVEKDYNDKNDTVEKKANESLKEAVQCNNSKEIIPNAANALNQYNEALNTNEYDRWETIIGKTTRYYQNEQI